jgi:branched-chain amino acid transport system substrate-binding protein
MTPTALNRVPRLAALVVAATVAVAACSSGGSEAGSNGGSDKTVALGLITSLTGPLSALYGKPTVAATQARVDLANNTNEIPGVKLKLVVGDDQSTPTGALAATQVLVNEQHIFALVDASAVFAGAYKYTVQRNLPVLGWPDSREFSDPANKNLFAYFGSPSDTYAPIKNLGLFLQSQGATKVCRLATANVPAATKGANQFADSAKVVGLPVPYSADIPPTTTDMNSYALAMQKAGCDSVVMLTPPNTVVALLRDLANLGVHLKATIGPSYHQEALDPSVVAAEEGLDFLSQYQPYWMNTPAVNNVKAAMKKYANVDTEAPAAGFYWGWIPADLAITGFKLPGASKSQSTFINELRKVNNYDAGGFICPVDFTKASYVVAGVFSTCLYMSKIKSGHFVTPTNVSQPIRLQ